MHASAVVVATGGLSIPSMGTTPFGYELAEQFNLPVTPLRASLVPYTFDGDYKQMFAKLSGNAINCQISFDKISFEEAMLFTHRGLSGPAVLQISNYWIPGQSVIVNLLPSIDVESLLIEAKKHRPKVIIRTILNEHLPRNLVLELESFWWSEFKEKPLSLIHI